MSFESNYLKLRAEREKNSAKPAGDVKSPAGSKKDSFRSSDDSFTSRYLTLRNKRESMSIAERAEERVRLLKQEGTSYPTGSILRNLPTSKGYYSPPTFGFGGAGEQLHGNITAMEPVLKEKLSALDTARTSLVQSETDLKTVRGYLDQARETYNADPSEVNAASYNQIAGAYNLAYDSYSAAFKAYSAAYDDYKPYEEEAINALTLYRLYGDNQQDLFNHWRGTIRDAETIRNDIAAIDQRIVLQEATDKAAAEAASKERIAQYEEQQKEKPWYEKMLGYLGETQDTSLPMTGVTPGTVESAYSDKWKAPSQEMQSLLDAKKLLEEELDWSRYYYYTDYSAADDFEEMSKYVPQERKKRRTLDLLMDNYSDDASGWEDPLYEYINGNEEAGAYLSNAGANYYGSDTPLGSIFGRVTESKSESQQMEDPEIAIFNYLYATQGKAAAHAYYNYLQKDLNYRQRKADETQWKLYASEHPGAASVFSVAVSPLKGLSYLGQLSDIVGTGTIDENAGYNKFSYVPSAIRGQVVEQMEAKGNWGKVGSFAYKTGLSMADFLLTSALTGGNQTAALAIMGSGAAADTVISAKDRGLNDGQAFTLGTIAGIAEAVIESMNMETVFKPDLLKEGILKYILKNGAAEGLEEVGTDAANLVADILISKDKSEWQASIDNYMRQNMTEAEAIARALGDQALTMALDYGGGFISGSIMSGGTAMVNTKHTKKLGKQLGELDLDESDIQAFIETGLESDPDTASYQLAKEMQAKIEAGEELSNNDLARLYKANVQAIQAEEESSEDLPTIDEKSYEGEVSAETIRQQAQADYRAGKITEAEFDAIIDEVMHLEELEEGTSVKTFDNQTNTVADDIEEPKGLQLPSLETDPQTEQSVTTTMPNVTASPQNVTPAQINDTVLPTGVPLSVADQLRLEQAQNGGTQYESTQRTAAGPAASQPEEGLILRGGAGISDGSTEWHAGAGTAEQTGVLASSPEQRRSAYADRSRATVARQNYARSLRLEKVSSLDLGLQNGTEARNIQVVPQENWDTEMSQLADRIYNETGKRVTYVMGRIQIRGTGGTVGYARGVITGDRIIVQADHLRIPMEQIADHEAYHAKVDFTDGRLNDEIRRHIVETFSEEQFRQVLDKYIVGLRGVIDVNETHTGAEFEAAVRQIEEEIFADAYAGINAFGAGADQFTSAVNEKMDQLYMGKIRNQDNGTEESTGPPSDRYSFAGENANNADLDALARAKQMQAAGVADETIRQQTGWHTGMDGKWRWEIDDSKMQYTSRGDLGLRERRPEYARYRELLDKSNRYVLELSNEALTPEETAELQKLKDIWGGTFRKAGRITEDALPTDLLSDYVKHDDLFEAYPQLRKTRLRFAELPEGTRGQYDPEQDVITLSESLRGKPQDTLIHEIQHVIQKAEGFAQGSSPEFWDGQQVVPPEYASEIQKAEDTVKKVEAEFHQEWPDDINLNLVKQYIELDNQLWGDGTDSIALQELADQMEQIEQLATESGWGDLFNDYYYAVGQLQMAKERAKLHRRASIDLYRNTAGEIEARDAASRRQLTAEQRRSAEPARADDRTVFVEDIDDAAFAELDAQYGPQLQSAAEFDQDTISGNIRQVARMEPVTSISGHEFAKGEVDLITQVETFFNQRGNRAYSPELGEVILDRKGVKSDIAHGIGRKKAAAFAAVPDVIEHGLVVDYQKDWKGRGYDTAVVAAPITIGDQTHAAAVILLRSDQTNRFYVHEVLAMENGALPFKTGTREGYPGGDAPSILSILDKIRSVKNETVTQERFSMDDASTQQSQDQKPAAPKKKIRPVAESRPLIAKKDLRNTVLNLFSIPNGQRAEVGAMIDSYADRLIKNGSLTEDDRKAFFDRMYDAGVMVMPAEEYSAFARSHIVDGRIYVSDSVKSDFGNDWADIRRRAFAAGVYLVNDRSASGIDQWNATLSAEDMLPGLFDSEETDERTILERILQVAEEGKDEHLSLAEYTRRLSQQEGISEDEFLDNMERQLDWALRTFAEKARLEVHLRDRTGRKIAQEREKGAERMTRQQAKEAQRRADERQARKDSARRAKERRELRELQQRTLKQLQWLSKNRNRAPEELQATWDEVLGDIDLYAISAADEMRWSDKHNATWKDLAQMYKDASENDPNFMPSKELQRIVDRLDATKIADMDLGALQDLYKAAIGLRTEFYNRNNVINDEMQRLFAEVYTDAKREIENAPGENSAKKGKVSGWADKFLNLDQLTPMNVLQRMAGWDPDGAFYSMAKQLERGERDTRAYSVKAQKMLQDFLTEHEDWVKKADGQGEDAIWYEVEVPQLLELHMGDKPIFGPTVKVYMTPAQKVHMYLESKNLDNLRHMTGGRTFVNKDLYSQGKRQEALSQGRTIKLAPETVRKLVSDLTPEEMELAQILDRYYNTFATQEINKVSNILYGYDKAMGKNYAPIYTNRNYTKTEFGVFDTTAEGVGNLKGRQYAVNPSYNISAFDAFERHVDQTARFCGMAIPARNWTTLMNWRENNNSTGDVITHKWGEQGKKYIENLITTLQAGDDAKSESVSSIASKLQNNYISAVFGANPSIVLKQLGSIPLAGAYLDARNMPTPAQISKIDRSLISKYTQELEWRTMGYATPETKQLKDNPNWTQTNKAFKFVFGGGAITAMDGWAASTLWPWAENKVRREHPELAVGTKAQIDAGESAFYKKVAEEFEIAVSRSQSVSDEIHQGTLRKSKNPITKAFTMFRSDSAQTYNALRQKIGEAQFYARTGAKDKVQAASKKAVGAVVCALLMNTVWSEAVSFLMALWKNKGKYYRDDEDELTAESVIGEMGRNMMESIMGTVTFGDEIAQLIGNAITGDRRYDLEAPGLEQINEIFNLVQDMLQGNFGRISEAADVVKNGGNLGEYLSDNSGEILGEIKDTATKVATYFGLPVNNVEAYLLGALKWVSPELGTAYDDLFQSIGKSDLAGMEGDALEGRVGRILSDRNVSEYDDTAAALAALYEAGYKTAIPSDTPTSVSIDGEKHSLGDYQQQAYDTIWGGIVADALDDMVASDSFKEADPKTQAKMLNNLYTYAAEQAKAELFDEYEMDSGATKNAAIVAAGATVAECITWNTITSEMKSGEKSAELASWDIPEEAKREIFRCKISDSREDSIAAFDEAGLSFDQFLQAYSAYGQINNEDLKAGMKAVEFSHWVNAQGYTAEQVAVVKDELTYFNMTPASSSRYDELVGSGMDPDDAYDLTGALNELQPEDGEDEVSDLQKWRASVDFSDDVEDQLAALSAVMTDAQFQKVEIANNFGVSPDAYVTLQEIKSRYDADGNGSYKNTEIQAAIEALPGYYTTEQKAALWQLTSGSTSAKNNPYSQKVGNQILEAKKTAKKQTALISDDTDSDSFSQEILKQLLGRG
jgi:hypothetical protein